MTPFVIFFIFTRFRDMDAVQEQNLLNHFQHNNLKSINVILPVQSTLANL